MLFIVSTCMEAVYSFQNPICAGVFLLLTPTCFFVCVHDRYDTINSHLTQTYICATATVNVKTMLLEFFYLCVSDDQLSSLPSDYNIFYMFLCTFVCKAYTKILSG